MTDHLPECSANQAILRPGAVTGQSERGTPVNAYSASYTLTHGPCICSALRACEQRIDAEWRKSSHFILGVQAAREAVAALPYGSPLDDALAAIDALRGES